MSKINQTAIWNQGYNIDSGIQTAAPSIKGYDDDEVASHHSYQQFEWDQGFSGEPMDTAINDQFNSTRRLSELCISFSLF